MKGENEKDKGMKKGRERDKRRGQKVDFFFTIFYLTKIKISFINAILFQPLLRRLISFLLSFI